MTANHLASKFYRQIVERRSARSYPWILLFITALYLISFPLVHVPILITIPVGIAGWFYYRRAGFLAGVLAFAVDLALVHFYTRQSTWSILSNLQNIFAVGHLGVLAVGVASGYLRETVELSFQAAEKNRLRERQLILINMAVRDILERNHPDEIYFRLLNHLCNLFVADYAYMTSWDERADRVSLVAATKELRGAPPGSVIEKAVLTREVLNTRKILIIDDARASSLVAMSPLARDTLSEVRSVLALPLVAREYQFGAAILAFYEPQKFDREEISHFELASSQIVLALRNALQERRIEQQLKEAHTLASIEQALSQSETIGLDAVLQLIVNAAREIIPGTTHAVLHLLQEDRQLLVPRAVSGNFEGRRSNLNMHIGQGVAGQVLEQGIASIIPDIRRDARFVNHTLPASFRSIAVAPVILNQKRIGTISIHSAEVNSFEATEVGLLTSLGTLSAIAIENASLYESMQEEIEVRSDLQDALVKSVESERELRLSAEVTAEASVALISNLDQHAVLNEILAQVQRLMPGFAYHIELLVDHSFLSVRAHRGFENLDPNFESFQWFPAQKIPLLWDVIRERKPIIVEDTQLDPRGAYLPAYSRIRSHASIPLLWKDQLLGILNIDHEQPSMISEQSLAKLKTMVNVAAVAIANSQLLENTQQALNETSSLYEIGQALVALDVSKLLENSVELLQKNFGYYHVQIYLPDPDERNLVLKAASGALGRILLERGTMQPVGLGIVGHVFTTSTPFVTNDVEDVLFFARNPFLQETASEMALPLKIGQETYGVLDIQQAAPEKLTSGDLRLVSAVADQLSIALQNAKLYEDLQSALEQEKSTRFQLMRMERLATVGRLLASISHELNNPLQAIQNVLFLLKSEENLSGQGKQDLEVILLETERMTSLISRLRATYRTPQSEEFQNVNLNSIIEDVYALTATYMRHQRIVFEFCPDPENPILAAIPDQIRQILLNLFMNSIDAMETGGKLLVQTERLPQRGQVLLTVSDTGSGISPEMLPQLFEPFTTDKESGTGLGMTITRDIVLQHHGQIEAQNNPEGGARFRVWLPLTRKV